MSETSSETDTADLGKPGRRRAVKKSRRQCTAAAVGRARERRPVRGRRRGLRHVRAFERLRAAHRAMSYCDACGDLYRVEAAHGAAAAKGTEGLVATCTSCGKVENVMTALRGGVTERSSGGETFLFKFGIEPMNPDGSKFGAVKEVTRERAVVDEKCPKCSHKGLNFYTMQLRSVDEGQTVFYECPKCGHTFSQNN